MDFQQLLNGNDAVVRRLPMFAKRSRTKAIDHSKTDVWTDKAKSTPADAMRVVF
jgi:hypothetical protein